MGYIKKDDFNFGGKFEPKKTKRLSSNAMLGKTKDRLVIQYVNTVVFDYDKKNQIVKLNTNGWTTKTSKKWINYGLETLSQSLMIKIEDYWWYVCSTGTNQFDIEMTYYDNFIIDLKKGFLKNKNKKYTFIK